MTAVFFILFFFFLTILGFIEPFVLSLCYMWVDILKPQTIGFGWIRGTPLALIAGILAIGSYLLSDRALPSRTTTLHVLLLLWGSWVTLTTFWAILPIRAWDQWDLTIKTILFSSFIPFVFRTRPQIEAFIIFLVLIPAVAIVPTAIKTLATGGGYGTLPPISGSTTLAESSTLSMVAIMSIPLVIYIANHSPLINHSFIYKAAGYTYVVMCLLVTIGTQARTGLVSVAALVISSFGVLKNRWRFIFIITVTVLAILPFLPGSWSERMSTISDPQSEASSESRIQVWAWTLEFVKSHPFGGGFDAYELNHLYTRGGLNQEGLAPGRPFHSIYFQVLGEHGYIGLIIYVLILCTTILSQFVLYKKAMPDVVPVDRRHLYRALLLSSIVFACGGAFLGVAYLPIFYYIAGITISMICEFRFVAAERADLPQAYFARRYTH